MEDLIRQAINQAVASYTNNQVEIELTYPETNFGDYASNIGLQLGPKIHRNPREVAEEIANDLRLKLADHINHISVAGPGFINFKLNDQNLWSEMLCDNEQPLAGQKIVIEFSDPNPFKILHAGHVYTSIVGNAIANLLAQAGATTYRVNYGGDVGLHVAKTIWAIIDEFKGEYPEKLSNIELNLHSLWLSQLYVKGNNSYQDNPLAKEQIIELNKLIYKIQADNDHDSALAKIYWTTREWSYQSFNEFYDQLNIHFDKTYTESQTAPIGLEMVNQQLAKGVFVKSKGAVVFEGDQYGLHTRVFVNSQGLPTYEAKELGLAELKNRDFNYDQSIIITANEQEQYMAVVLKALEQFRPELAKKTVHINHGMLRLSGGRKMSSRLGNTVTANDVLTFAREAAKKINNNADEQIVLAAVKYSMLKQRMGGDIIYDPAESVSIIGNSGPYLQYAYARSQSILAKANSSVPSMPTIDLKVVLNDDERSLVLKLSRFREVLKSARSQLSPNILCAYLYELTQEFNHFYERNRVIDDQRQDLRLFMLKIYSERLKNGLELLGIAALDKV